VTDPNVQTSETGEEVILEPGDPGYVEPGQQSITGEPIDDDPETVPGKDEPLGADLAPPGEDLQHVRRERESEAEFAARTRNVVVESTSPTDIVPNTPQISMGPRVPVEGAEGVSYATAPVEAGPSVVEEQPEPEEEVVVEGEPAVGGEPAVSGEPTDTSASALISRARAATTSEELDEIESLANDRVTVIDAVEARRAELAS
jgi:hypothetical protein